MSSTVFPEIWAYHDKLSNYTPSKRLLAILAFPRCLSAS
jgi:hypothetical protein